MLPNKCPRTPLVKNMWRQSPLTILVLKPGITPEKSLWPLGAFFNASSWVILFHPRFPFSWFCTTFWLVQGFSLQCNSQHGLWLAQNGSFSEFLNHSWSPWITQKNPLGPLAKGAPFSRKKGRIIFQRFSLWIMGWAHSILQCCKWPMSHLLYSFWDSHWWGNGKISWTFAAEGCPRSRPSKNRDSDTLLHPHARRGGLGFFPPPCYYWMVFQPIIPFFKGCVPESFQFLKWKDFFKPIIVGQFCNIWWGKKHDAASTSFFNHLGFLHGTQMSMGSGIARSLQKDTIRSLCMFPGWVP